MLFWILRDISGCGSLREGGRGSGGGAESARAWGAGGFWGGREGGGVAEWRRALGLGGRDVLGKVGDGGRGGGRVLLLDCPPDLLPVHRDGPRGCDADADARAADLDHLDHDVVAEHDLLSGTTGDDEHVGDSSLERCWLRATRPGRPCRRRPPAAGSARVSRVPG